MLYLVKIGRNTRRGDFQEMYSIPVESEATTMDVMRYYQNKYAGFGVSVFEFSKLEIEKPDIGRHYLTDIPVTYTAEEKEIAKQYREKEKEAGKLKEELHGKILSRIKSYEFVVDGYYPGVPSIQLATSGNTTVIKILPIHGAAFIQHIGEGKRV